MAAPSFFTDEDGNVVLVQPPNPPLIGWLAFRVGALVTDEGTLHNGLSVLATASLATWGYLELTAGASPFRRVLGGAALAAVVVGAFT